MDTAHDKLDDMVRWSMDAPTVEDEIVELTAEIERHHVLIGRLAVLSAEAAHLLRQSTVPGSQAVAGAITRLLNREVRT